MIQETAENLGDPDPLSLSASPFLTGAGGTPPMGDLDRSAGQQQLREKYVYLEGERKARVLPKFKRRRKRRRNAADYVTVPASETASADDDTTGGRESRRDTEEDDEDEEEEEKETTMESTEDNDDDDRCGNGLRVGCRGGGRGKKSHRSVTTGVNEMSYTVVCEKTNCTRLPPSAIRTISEQLDRRDNSNKSSPNRHAALTPGNCVEDPDARCQPQPPPAATSAEENVTLSRTRRCANCCKAFLAFLCSTVGLSCLMVGYVILGGFIFQGLEAPNEKQMNHEMRETRLRHVQQLWELTEAMNVLHPGNWSTVAEEILENYTAVVYMFAKKKGWDGKDEDQELQWSFAGALLYSITVVTTIGYGHIAPKTDWGRVVTMLYAIIGIPLTLLTITNLGGFMATAFRFLYKNICCGLCCLCCPTASPATSGSKRHRRRRRPPSPADGDEKGTASDGAVQRDRRRSRRSTQRLRRNRSESVYPVTTDGDGREATPTPPAVKLSLRERLRRVLVTEDIKTVTVPIYVSLLLITGYIAIGALLFTLWEKEWNYLIGCYFCFITLSTIGFGDYVPGTSLGAWNSQEKLVLCALYLLVGLALIAMCFDLMQEQARNSFKKLGQKLGLIDKQS